MELLTSILSNLSQLCNASRLVVSYTSKPEILASKNIWTIGFIEKGLKGGGDFDKKQGLTEMWI